MFAVMSLLVDCLQQSFSTLQLLWISVLIKIFSVRKFSTAIHVYLCANNTSLTFVSVSIVPHYELVCCLLGYRHCWLLNWLILSTGLFIYLFICLFVCFFFQLSAIEQVPNSSACCMPCRSVFSLPL